MPDVCATRFDELKATNQLPSPTGVALAILRLAESDKTTSQEIARVLQTDPALSGRILKLTNSAVMGRPRPVTSVREAVTHLGVRMVRNVALGFSLVSQHARGVCREFNYTDYWSRSLAMGVAAQTLAQQTGQIAPAEAFTCGLLAQVGRLALASIYPEAYGSILVGADAISAEALCRREREQFATDHNELTGALLKDWGLPAICVSAAQHYEAPERSGFAENDRVQVLVRLLYVASLMADICVTGGEGRPGSILNLFAASEDVGIAAPALIELCDRIAVEWQDWGRFLQVTTRVVPPFAELVSRARISEPEIPAPSASEPPTPDLGPRIPDALTIVVAEDQSAERSLLIGHLQQFGHSVHAVSDGDTALRIVLEVNPHLVIISGSLPDMDGTTLVKALRQAKLGRQVYVIMLTIDDDDEAQIAAFEAGADDSMQKPFAPKLLAARLRACARVVGLQEEVRRDKEELCRCLAELGVANRKLQQAALTDPLTGLYNRRYALDRLEQEWADAMRNDQPLACLVFDIDHFKKINDTYGHDVGDRALAETATLLRTSVRRGDVVCRMGGEEFLAIGPGLDHVTAMGYAERLRAAAAEQVIETEQGAVRLTLSIGVAVMAATTRDPAALLKAADEAMYAAKQNGRNRVCLAGFAPADKAAGSLSVSR